MGTLQRKHPISKPAGSSRAGLFPVKARGSHYSNNKGNKNSSADKFAHRPTKNLSDLGDIDNKSKE